MHDHHDCQDHSHSHSGSGGHHHHLPLDNKKALFSAIIVNILLTVVQLVGGVFSGSLALVADAVHNFSDAGSLLIAYFAQKIANFPANSAMTYGYKRAEIIGALINSSLMILIAIYLVIEAVSRFIYPQSVNGWVMIIIAGIALVVDLFTVALLFRGAKTNLNMKAAFLHNIADAASSVIVIISGVLVLYFENYIFDIVATFIVAVYVVVHAYAILRQSLKIIMQAVPYHLDINKLSDSLMKINLVTAVEDVHVWQLDDKTCFLEAKILLSGENSLTQMIATKLELRKVLQDKYQIKHSTLELVFENEELAACQLT
ncbi:MAG: cation transporter [Oligoflexales bacterium]|nr:cation transporter [Oligoflexales bacterium]